MDELLAKLLESEILTAEAQEELREAWNTQLEEAKEAAREAAIVEVTASLTEKFVSDKEQLVEALDQKVTDMFEAELDELKEEFDAHKDLEADYAEKLIEAKAALADEVQVDLANLVDELDAFVEVQLAEEVSELREDIEASRQDQLGRKIFEAFSSEYAANYHDEDDAAQTLAETTAELRETETQLEEALAVAAEYERNAKMNALLAPLGNQHREMMETILKNVATSRLDETYETFIGRVVRKTEDNSEKEDNSVLSEDVEVNDEAPATDDDVLSEDVVIVTGDKVGNEDAGKQELSESAKQQIADARRLAGLEY